MILVLLSAALLHPFHETVSEVEWNSETKRLEVALRLSSLDEEWLRRQVQGSGPSGDDSSKWVIAYLQRKYRITERPRPGQPDDTTYHWIGREEKGSSVWWFVEIEPHDGQRPSWIDARVLFEREENYLNRILILGQVPRRSLTLTIQRPRANLEQTADERDSTESHATADDGATPADR